MKFLASVVRGRPLRLDAEHGARAARHRRPTTRRGAAKRGRGAVRVYVDGQPVGSAVRVRGLAQGAIKLPDISELLAPGEHKIELRMESGAELPYSIAVAYNALVPPESSTETKVALEVALAKTALTEGEPAEAQGAGDQQERDERLPTAVAIFGVPGGLEPRHDQLKELVKRKTVDAYEVIGRDVVLVLARAGRGRSVATCRCR